MQLEKEARTPDTRSITVRSGLTSTKLSGGSSSLGSNDQQDLFSMLLLETPAPGLHQLEGATSSPTLRSLSPKEQHESSSYARELLQKVIQDQAETSQEDAVFRPLKSATSSLRLKKKTKVSNANTDWNALRHEIDNLLNGSSLSSSRKSNGSGGTQSDQSTQRIRNTSPATPQRVPDLPPPQSPSSRKMVQDVLECCDGLSVQSELTGLTGVFTERQVTVGSPTVSKSSIGQPSASPISATVVEEPQNCGDEVQRKQVSFGTIMVRNYQRILSSNPSCTSGPAIGLGWKYQNEQSFKVDEYESRRAAQQQRKRSLLLSRQERESILLELGYSSQSLAKAVRGSIRTKNQRKQTVNNLRAAVLEERVENASRKVKKALVLLVAPTS